MYHLYLNWTINEKSFKQNSNYVLGWMDRRFGHLFMETWQPCAYVELER